MTAGPANWSLPPDGEAVIGGVRLPAGQRISAGRPREPVLWATGEFEGAARAWLTLRERLDGTALVPLLLSDLERQPGRPWESGELWPCNPLAAEALTAPAVLRDQWEMSEPVPEEDEAATAEVLAPFSRSFPGLAPAASGRADPGQLREAVLSVDGPLRIGLAVAGRPADALVSVGWGGAANYHDTPAPLTAVLRSWEERFGATLMHLGFDVMDLLVERPVWSPKAALAVAAEHFAFCADNVYQGEGTIRGYAARLPGATTWSFWWD